jgi:alpha-amylase
MGDDGEKFGGWPTTFEYCWGETAWVERFFAALEANADWLATITPSGWLDGHGSVGRVYLPTGSYAEMGEWALPPDEGRAFARAVHDASAEGRPEARWLRGAIWRNFQVKYREVNDLHKQMLRASDLVDALPDGPGRAVALDHLFAGQSNDCYWHGLFGGIYLPDLRVAALGRLIGAEDIVLGGSGAAVESGRLVDLDLDGSDEALLVSDGQIVAIKLDEGAGIGRWDLRAARFPLAAVMRRRPEAYHEKLREHAAKLLHPIDTDGSSSSRPASIHDIVATKQEGLADLLQYDTYERRSGLVRLLPPTATATEVAEGGARDLVPALDGPWTLAAIVPNEVTATFAAGPVSLVKTIRLGGGRADPRLAVEVSVENVSDVPFEALLGLEFAVMLLGGGHNPAAWHEVAGRRLPHDEFATASGVERLLSGNDQLGIRLETLIRPAADAWISPIRTVSNSEGGFELVYQGSCIVALRPIRLEPGERTNLRIEQVVSVTADRAANEVVAAR